MVFKIKYWPVLIIIVGLVFSLSFCAKNDKVIPVNNDASSKFCGVSFASPHSQFYASEFESIKQVNANYICLMPFAFGEFDTPELAFDREFQWWGEKTEGIIASINYAREKELKIMLKPHLWFSHGDFTGDFVLNNEADWQTWEENYMNYILYFARLADSLDVEMFCIGVELKGFVAERPTFWNNLIDTVRNVYKGKLVYAANWDNYPNIPFWEKLDYIGVDAYFPLSEEKTPGVEALKTGWVNHLDELNAIRMQVNKPVIFTEYGYRSIDYTGSTPWNPEDGDVNLTAQKNAYEALYEAAWAKDWIVGGFVWKWRAGHETAGGSENSNYTPQNKPAEETIRNYYNIFNR